MHSRLILLAKMDQRRPPFRPTVFHMSKKQIYANQNSRITSAITNSKKVWEDISMDFITHLPVFAGHSVVWIICDRLSKYVHFIALPTHFTAQQLTRRFLVEICRLHGVPKTIVSDRDPLFVSSFWQHLFKAQGTMLKFSSSYHPQTDGQTEILNRGLEAYLRCFVGSQPNKWYQYLHLAE